ncbi:hypothetical protein [Microbulbifer sp. TYP-18]|uniref:hypothetical protein n=1 Tax=Microbulbifer sp. TYP-18 TaxID=3230024 RepID=UPI0034C5CCFB
MSSGKQYFAQLSTRIPLRLRQQLLAAVIWLALAFFCAIALNHHHTQQKSATIARDRAEAEVAAALMARQSLEGIVARDPISLQLLAQQLLALPAVTGVTVQDVEGKPLAQVGDLEHGEVVTAPVVLHDSLAGSVSVNLQPGSDSGYPWGSLLLSLAFALPFSAAAALAAGNLTFRRALPVVETKASPSRPEPEREERVGLYLRPLNWAQLSNQLSRAALDKLQRDLDERLQLLCRIYEARPVRDAGPQQGLDFGGEDAAFRAVCCGLLLFALQRASRSTGLKLALAVAPAGVAEFDFAGEQLLGQSTGLALHPALEQDESLDRKVLLHSAGWGLEVRGLAQGYQQLLDNQLRQLTSA